MSLVKVKEYLKQYGKDKEIIEFNESSATVSEVLDVVKQILQKLNHI